MSTTKSEVITVTSRTVACDGGDLGHPRVFLTVGDDGQVVCPYCSHTFVLEDGADEGSDH